MKNLFALCMLAMSLIVSATPNPDPTSDRPGKITGVVIDKNLQAPLPYVAVVIKDLAGEIITGGVTDDNGKFIIETQTRSGF